MPELPEVEIVRLFLQKNIIGKTIAKITILNPNSFIGNFKLAINKKITQLTRRGKQLSIFLSNDCLLLIHLKMTGQLVYQPCLNQLDTVIPSKAEGSRRNKHRTFLGHPTPKLNHKPLPNKSTRIIFTFSDKSILFFNDQRKFAWVKIIKKSQLKKSQSNLGPDILSLRFTFKYFYSQLQSSSRPIKNLLHDQSKFAGIGNIYANDSLFLAKIHPQTPARNISPKQSQLLYSSIKKIIKEAVSFGGSTARDNQYIRPDNTKGSQQYNFRVYQKEGELCKRCGHKIVRLKLSGRSAFYCPHCQKQLE
ncbi:bifunctional DNA-formamidopyrimidine glycosylase/DNA-(apurinic or apyrimidinic site) lyase [Patescibacteria group bacterium]|nr:bifunctional DNA-formamidopyrimidine glycosylase/DNA-(apurinic or apyrimidinic site) lyase [Patescibacteria group bacterium]MCG2701676.1 bifunctional DNA-formamidopyrimidine glycosylase/DNA-(apurinic or apyrimidinic site) lyase [Candidatus Parcubacteria bacterium]MBU4265389.1 bifunctional DNA-formamidopyrimidine glycosylase/DNA-(apurinic or apyrimidinic site) lyase [Patescibacteria group bacterium]MBU4390341.1 bifunctional DNA-formamidopyrimidine glycosylase/DNA-(apurinic or apyrimidinic site